MTQTHHHTLGIDIGSVSVGLAELDPEGRILRTAYRSHQGNVRNGILSALADFHWPWTGKVAVSASTPDGIAFDRSYDNRVAIMAAARRLHGEVGTLLLVGGETFGAVFFDAAGNYLNYRANTSCAAGTGAFLDQQAGRLNLPGIEALAEVASQNNRDLPKIATRCAVFAKTDLIHAQQEGYALGQICDGLCHGLARNIVNTLFSIDPPLEPILFVGGVSQNPAVKDHLRSLTGKQVIVDRYGPLYGAIGAALLLIEERDAPSERTFHSPEQLLIKTETGPRPYYHPPLDLTLSDYPDFAGIDAYIYHQDAAGGGGGNGVEVDIYAPLPSLAPCPVWMGFDIGSTSTKAVLLHADKRVLAGFYTRTAGQPVAAVQSVLAAIDDAARQTSARLTVLGAGTTGSGRKLAGKIIGADLILDEISAHARAAYELNPAVDTIIEIGGQDSKFTNLTHGQVTFCVMNTVCAAGTGSFIEEQARKLGCPLSQYAERTQGQRAPIASDRCTVFMERDLNHYLSKGYTADEALASVLHSVRENYLTKVAATAAIGDTILFQGATAKNRALAAAFEQGLGKPIHVSRYCHLTGAMGTALALADAGVSQTRFEGIDLHRRRIPVRSEVCDLCANHCKLTVAEMDGRQVAYGFLCGRDYDTRRFVDNNRSGFDLLKARKKAFDFQGKKDRREDFTIGLPAGLHLLEDLPMWRKFFDELGIRTATSDPFRDGMKLGRRLAGAEFCAPMTAFHGHVRHLLDTTNYVFLPIYLEKNSGEKNVRRQYCYYTQFATSVAAGACDPKDRPRLLSPLIEGLYHAFHAKTQLYRMLRGLTRSRIRFLEVSAAYDAALKLKTEGIARLQSIYTETIRNADDIHVALLGRPYTILSPWMNKKIPAIFGTLGIPAFYQDMIPGNGTTGAETDPLLKEIHWRYAAEALKAAKKAADIPGAYPVWITSFKCTPDAFALEYFRDIMEAHGKPYLILQLDEHDSSVGYETRIEAAARAFRNHHAAEHSGGRNRSRVPVRMAGKTEDLADRTLLFPNWDPLALRLVTAALRKEGVDARLLEESETAIQESLRLNSGQCLPLNIVAQEFVDYVRNHDLDPARTALWMIDSAIACNLGLYLHHIRRLAAEIDPGMAAAAVYMGDLSFYDISLRLPVNIYFAYMFGGMIRKMGCRIRPYEIHKGETDRVIEESIALMEDAFSGQCARESALDETIAAFRSIETAADEPPRPKAAIFGDLYVRDNPIMNQHLIRYIEKNGGEVVTTPYSDYVKMISGPYLRKWFREGKYLSVLSSSAFLAATHRQEKRYYEWFQKVLGEPQPRFDAPAEDILSAYHIRPEHTGESMDNIMKVYYLKKHHPDIALFVQTSPAFCCPALITEAMARRIETVTQTPVVSITYDGTGGDKNSAVIPYLKYPRRSGRDDRHRDKAARHQI